MKSIQDFFEYEISKKDENFANWRLARNIYDDLVINYARRVMKIDNISRDDLSLITPSDFLDTSY